MSRGKKLAAAALAVLSVRLALLCGAGAAVRQHLQRFLADGGLVSASVELELGSRGNASPSPGPSAAPSAAAESPAAPPADSPSPSPGGADEPEILATTISGGLAIKNTTDLAIDPAQLMAEPLTQDLSGDGPQILIIHTHSSEAYTPDGADRYAPTDTDRTEDTRYNVVRVGDELAAALESYGLRVLHDREIYDYPSYTGSYARSGEAVAKHLEENPSIAVVIDLHRDALGENGVVYKTVAEVSGECSSQVMLLCGTGESGLPHPNWKENLKLALRLQKAMEEKYPTLARPVCVVPERYNQHLSAGSLILEVGSSGNTLQEALCAARLFADAAAPALLALAQD